MTPGDLTFLSSIQNNCSHLMLAGGWCFVQPKGGFLVRKMPYGKNWATFSAVAMRKHAKLKTGLSWGECNTMGQQSIFARRSSTSSRMHIQSRNSITAPLRCGQCTAIAARTAGRSAGCKGLGAIFATWIGGRISSRKHIHPSKMKCPG